MMEQSISQIDLQQAWQTAFQLRTCPTDTVLRAEVPDENLEKHLAFCSICREKRAMPAEQIGAWQKLFDQFVPQIHQAVNDPHSGQVWILKKELSCWGDDGYYYSPPNILLLENLDKGRFLAVQLYTDKCLMGEGDVWLGDRFGFAQTWNCYAISKGALECWLGIVTATQIADVLQAGSSKYSPIEEHSVLSFFRELEKTVGAYAALSPALDTKSVEEKVIDMIPGLKLAIVDAGGFLLDITLEALNLLRGTFKPALVLRGGTPKPPEAKLTDEQKKMVLEQCQVIPVDVKVTGDTLAVTLKWLRNKPVELPVVKVVLNAVDVPDAGFTNATADKIIIKHSLLSGVTTSQIASLKLSCLEGTLSFDITVNMREE